MACNAILSTDITSPHSQIVLGGDVTLHGTFTDDGGPEPCTQNVAFARKTSGGLWVGITSGGYDALSGVAVTHLWEPPTLGLYEFRATASYCPDGWSGTIPLGPVEAVVHSSSIFVRVMDHAEYAAHGPSRSAVAGGEVRSVTAEGAARQVTASAASSDQSVVANGPRRSATASP